VDETVPGTVSCFDISHQLSSQRERTKVLRFSKRFLTPFHSPLFFLFLAAAGGSDSAESHFRQGEVLAHRGDMTGATEEYRTAIRLQPEFAAAHRGLGVVLLDQHDWPGRALMGLRDWPGSAAALDRATQLKPDDAEAFSDLGLVRMVQGDPAAAATALRRAIELKPDHADSHHLLEIVQAAEHDPEHLTLAARRILDTMFARE
jgi:cytochrome c-type biogenesis protein CcmH/NrfG